MRKAIILWIARVLRVNVHLLVRPTVTDTIKWISVKDGLPVDTTREYLICHYNNFTEVARFEKGEWFAISNKISVPDEKLSEEGQPDDWLLIELPE